MSVTTALDITTIEEDILQQSYSEPEIVHAELAEEVVDAFRDVIADWNKMKVSLRNDYTSRYGSRKAAQTLADYVEYVEPFEYLWELWTPEVEILVGARRQRNQARGAA